MVSAWVPIIAPGGITTAVAEEVGDDVGQHEYSEGHLKGEAVGDAELLCSGGETSAGSNTTSNGTISYLDN
jgi:hypothetical protein